LENILKHIQGGSLKGLAEVTVVVASRPGIRGIGIAEAAGVPTHVIRRKEFPSTEAYSDAMVKRLDEHQVDLVCLAGFLSYWTIPDRYLGRVMNIHPALLPSFGGEGMYGHHVHEAVLARGCKVSGCTVHFVNNTYDDGPIILQRAVPVRADDTPDALAARVFEQECLAYPEAIRLFAEGRLRIEGRIVRVLPGKKRAEPKSR
ncbi:MAG TPA: phosphoribosylglycinamide formyltransferase, partial [Phycisphaerae bacterium]|nr:phosphoribosylglycinamide formyltransferase [Phycisphaerae bacterium]